MTNTYEFLRVLLYLVGTIMLVYMGYIQKEVKLVFYSLACYFLMWASLLAFQWSYPEQYRNTANMVATPSLFIIVLCIFCNFWSIRKN